MYRYQGNTGRYVRVPEESAQTAPKPQSPAPQPRREAGGPGGEKAPPRELGGGLSNLLSGLFSNGFELEDALLLLILYLMYRETGDKELLIMMGAMLLP